METAHRQQWATASARSSVKPGLSQGALTAAGAAQSIQTATCVACALPTAHLLHAKPLFGPRRSWPVLTLRGASGATALILGAPRSARARAAMAMLYLRKVLWQAW